MKTVNPVYNLWYEEPAKKWEEALPLGNGRLGAMVYGRPDNEIVQVNEDSIWSGNAMQRNNKDSLVHLDEIRMLIKDGYLNEAQELALTAFSGTPENMRHYQTAGEINIVTGHREYINYKRELNLNTAITKVVYTHQNTEYEREIFCSAKDNMLVMHFTCKGEEKISFRALLYREADEVYAASNNTIALAYHKDIAFCNMLTACVTEGEVETSGCHLLVKDAKEVTLYFNSCTAFREKDYVKAVKNSLDAIKKENYNELKERHIKEYQLFFHSSSLSFSSDDLTVDPNTVPTNKRLVAVSDGNCDRALIELYFHYGRYLLISSSRPGTMPANLQGIWNNSMTPPWGSKYTININIQMNYWFAEMLGLSDLHLPLFDLLKKMHKQGKITAKEMYNCRGFVAHHNTDIWGDCAPQDYWLPGTYWVLGGAWLCLHALEHYEFTEDVEFLKEMFPIISDACLFLLDFLSEDKNGNLVLSPTASPENCYKHPSGQVGYLSAGCTMDVQILTELFTGYQKASAILGEGMELAKETADALKRMPQTAIGSDGTIREWLEEYEEIELGHRHISHLFGLHPGTTITMDETPDLVAAAKKTLEKRLSHGGGHTGWSRAWIINFYAKLGEGDTALENVKQLLIHSTLPNLFDNHPPFQIDGNFGGTAGIANMLIQSRENKIYLLPALPALLSSGSLSGFKAKHNVSMSMTWKDQKITSLQLTSEKEQEIILVYQDKKVSIQLGKGENIISL